MHCPSDCLSVLLRWWLSGVVCSSVSYLRLLPRVDVRMQRRSQQLHQAICGMPYRIVGINSEYDIQLPGNQDIILLCHVFAKLKITCKNLGTPQLT